MPILKNQRHEAFAQAIAMKANATEAYLGAGYNSTYGAAAVNAHKLLKDAKIIGRIEQLAKKAADRVEITKADVMRMLLENAQMSMGKIPFKLTVTNKDKETGETTMTTVDKYERDPSAANQALSLLGKELRMFVELKEIGAAGDFADKTDEEIIAELHELTSQLAGDGEARH